MKRYLKLALAGVITAAFILSYSLGEKRGYKAGMVEAREIVKKAFKTDFPKITTKVFGE